MLGCPTRSLTMRSLCVFGCTILSQILEPLGMDDTAWSVPGPNQHRVSALHTANPWVTNRLWGRKLTGEHSGHKSWLGWVGKPERRSVPEVDPADITEDTSMYSTALDQLAFHQMLLSGGVSASGARVLSEASTAAMTTDQLQLPLSSGDFNSHSQDKKNSSGMKSPVFGVDSEGQGVSYGMNVVTSAYPSCFLICCGCCKRSQLASRPVIVDPLSSKRMLTR
jgi:CubicO group peptidase (beta-lactamase class C family)